MKDFIKLTLGDDIVLNIRSSGIDAVYDVPHKHGINSAVYLRAGTNFSVCETREKVLELMDKAQ